MNKFILSLLFVLASPNVLAEGGMPSNGFIWFVSVILGNASSTNEAVIKLAMFAILFGAFVKSLGPYFRDFPTISKTMAAFISIIGIRLMPEAWTLGIGKMIWVAVLVILPYLIVSILLKKWNLFKIFVLAVAYMGIYFVAGGISLWGPGFVPNSYSYLYYIYSVYFYQIIIITACIIGYLCLRWSKVRKF